MPAYPVLPILGDEWIIEGARRVSRIALTARCTRRLITALPPVESPCRDQRFALCWNYSAGTDPLLGSRRPRPKPDEPALEHRFEAVVQPFLKSHCLACHGTLKREGKLDLSGYSSLQAVVKNPLVWDVVLERLEAEEMPPEKAPRQPLPHERRAVIEWIARCA